MKALAVTIIVSSLFLINACNPVKIGVGAKAPAEAEILFDGSRESLDENWIYWEGPRYSAEMPIKWEIMDTI